jgi:hypothetical protein
MIIVRFSEAEELRIIATIKRKKTLFNRKIQYFLFRV